MIGDHLLMNFISKSQENLETDSPTNNTENADLSDVQKYSESQENLEREK